MKPPLNPGRNQMKSIIPSLSASTVYPLSRYFLKFAAAGAVVAFTAASIPARRKSQQPRILAPHAREVSAILTKLAQSFVILTALAAAGLVTTSASADKLKDSGSVDMAYVKHCGQPIPDQDGHLFVFHEGEGTSTNKGGLVDGFSVRFWEITDLRQGTGTQQGYVIYSKGSDQRVDRIDGIVTTILKEGQPKTTFKGKWVIINGTGALAGIESEGTYAGYFTADDRFHVDWEGSRSQPKGAATKSQE
jgi:hypothetical protein